MHAQYVIHKNMLVLSRHINMLILLNMSFTIMQILLMVRLYSLEVNIL